MKNYIRLLLIICCYGSLYAQKSPKKIKSHKLFTKNLQVFTLDSIPLNGFYKVKYTDYLNDWKTEISHFKNGFRTGASKILRFNKLEEEGTYVTSLKHGTWKKYHYFNGNLWLTSEYKNGLKHGVEFGDHSQGGKFICNYINDSIDGSLLRYFGLNDYLGSKEYYKNGKIIYRHKYDDFLNIIEENNFTYNNNLILEVQTNNYGNVYHCDSIFYKDGDRTFFGKNIPYKIKKYRNDTLIIDREIRIEKDTTRSGDNDYVLITTSYDSNEKKASAYLFYNSLLLQNYILQEIKEIILYGNYGFNACFIYDLLIFQEFKRLTFYFKKENEDYFYEAEYDPITKEISSGCYKRKDPLSKFRQSF